MKDLYPRYEEAASKVMFDSLVDFHLQHSNFEAIKSLQEGKWKQNVLSENVRDWVWVKTDDKGHYFLPKETVWQIQKESEVIASQVPVIQMGDYDNAINVFKGRLTEHHLKMTEEEQPRYFLPDEKEKASNAKKQ